MYFECLILDYGPFSYGYDIPDPSANSVNNITSWSPLIGISIATVGHDLQAEGAKVFEVPLSISVLDRTVHNPRVDSNYRSMMVLITSLFHV